MSRTVTIKPSTCSLPGWAKERCASKDAQGMGKSYCVQDENEDDGNDFDTLIILDGDGRVKKTLTFTTSIQLEVLLADEDISLLMD